jgi:hypothetical protein
VYVIAQPLATIQRFRSSLPLKQTATIDRIAGDAGPERRQACKIASGPRQAGNKTRPDWIGDLTRFD